MEFCASLADLAVNYSIGVKKGDLVLIGGPDFALDLIQALFVEVLKAGGHPIVRPNLPGLQELLFRHASEGQLEFVDPSFKVLVERVNAFINIYADYNTRKLEQIPPEKVRKSRTSPGQQEMQKIYMEREGKGELLWVVVPYPCEALAQEAGMDLFAYRDFIANALALEHDPVAHWLQVERKQDAIIKQLEGVDQIHVVGDDTDLTLSIKGRTWRNSCGHRNLPDGEVYTGPVEDSINGHIRFTYPGIYQGKEVKNIYLEFVNGKVVKGTADKGQDLLDSILKIEGADQVGEFAIGTNYAISTFTKSMLFDEKMGGTMHMALGTGYPQTGSKAKSMIHWDILKDMKGPGSKIYADGRVIYEAGEWKI